MTAPVEHTANKFTFCATKSKPRFFMETYGSGDVYWTDLHARLRWKRGKPMKKPVNQTTLTTLEWLESEGQKWDALPNAEVQFETAVRTALEATQINQYSACTILERLAEEQLVAWSKINPVDVFGEI
ncbi:hypothetical protein [Roseibium sp. RKSG952]|uniref:hypothetical protein n=1 Tax=Roseibium sp. RKSG952 TaxID=2529384 RepID=UPI0012BD3B9A|nr:hypothetical protein [Roseibium sp. RKSG952]MTH96539.1 hypothetical protein [Roseibium sp. RKSG952]